MGNRDRPDFDPAKYVPKTVANKKQIDSAALLAYFQNHTLGECGAHFNCHPQTAKNHLRAMGVDTSIHNHSALAKQKFRQKVEVRKPTSEELRQLYLPAPLGQNWDTKSIAEFYGCHYNVIRKLLKQLGLLYQKTPQQCSQAQTNRHFGRHGVFHPAQRKDVLAKTRRSTVRARYVDRLGRQHEFRSLHELAYALLLDSKELEWYYEDMTIPYVDMLSGKKRVYVIDFTVIDGEQVSWVEVKPAHAMIPDDKALYAHRRAEEAGVEFRVVTEGERAAGLTLLAGGMAEDRIEFTYPTSRSATRITRYSRDGRFAPPPGWAKLKVRRWGDRLYSHAFEVINAGDNPASG